MALTTCSECGKQISTKAESCPSCGAKQHKRIGIAGKLILILLGLGASMTLISTIIPNTDDSTNPVVSDAKPSVEEKAKKEAFNKQVLASSVLVNSIRQSARDPDSVKLISLRTNETGSVACAEFRAKNGFGGMEISQASYYNNTISQRVSDWNKRCTGQMISHLEYVEMLR